MNAPTDTYTVNRRDLQRRFDRAANTFDSADFVHTHARDSLLERLEPVVVDARTVVDLGCATGQASRALSKRYSGAHLISVDLSREMLRAHSRPRWFAKRSAVQADATALPFADHSVDVVFCWGPTACWNCGAPGGRLTRVSTRFALRTCTMSETAWCVPALPIRCSMSID
jgi:malonyl-CoA O-methyltransferase